VTFVYIRMVTASGLIFLLAVNLLWLWKIEWDLEIVVTFLCMFSFAYVVTEKLSFLFCKHPSAG
jgi:hypothetical protein